MCFLSPRSNECGRDFSDDGVVSLPYYVKRKLDPMDPFRSYLNDPMSLCFLSIDVHGPSETEPQGKHSPSYPRNVCLCGTCTIGGIGSKETTAKEGTKGRSACWRISSASSAEEGTEGERNSSSGTVESEDLVGRLSVRIRTPGLRSDWLMGRPGSRRGKGDRIEVQIRIDTSFENDREHGSRRSR